MTVPTLDGGSNNNGQCHHAAKGNHYGLPDQVPKRQLGPCKELHFRLLTLGKKRPKLTSYLCWTVVESVLFEGAVEHVPLDAQIVGCAPVVDREPGDSVLGGTLAEVVDARLVITADDVMSCVVDCAKVVTVAVASAVGDVWTDGACVSRAGGVVCGPAVTPWEVVVG